MKNVSIEEIDLNNSYFHFTEKSNLKSIEEQGLKAQIGDASKMVGDKSRVCFSKGGKGILGIKNSFIYEFKNLRVCEIPEGYRKYFSDQDFSSKEIVKPEAVYDAMEKRFADEAYLKVDAKEGEDFLNEETFGIGSDFDIKGKENHDIDKEKLSLVNTPNGSSALDVIKYIYNRLLKNNPGKEDLIKRMNSDLSGMLDYVQEKNINKSDKNDNEFLKGLVVDKETLENNKIKNLENNENPDINKKIEKSKDDSGER